MICLHQSAAPLRPTCRPGENGSSVIDEIVAKQSVKELVEEKLGDGTAEMIGVFFVFFVNVILHCLDWGVFLLYSVH